MAFESNGESVCENCTYDTNIVHLPSMHHFPCLNFRCDICQKFFKTSKAMSHHRLQHSQERNFICDLCGRDFARKFQLHNHLKYYCTGMKAKRPCRRNRSLKDMPGATEKCPKRLMTSTVISTIDAKLSTIYAKAKHKRKPQKFVCDLCGRCYTVKTSLEYHQANHHGDANKAQCPICSAW